MVKLRSCLVFAVLFCLTVPSWAAPDPSLKALEGFKDIGVDEHLGKTLDFKDLSFVDESGKSVALDSYFNQGKPVLISLVYFECPSLCTFVLNGLSKTLRETKDLPGEKFEVLTLSINPKEGPELAARKKASYVTSVGKPEVAKGWHFLTGQEPQILKVADQLGFRYKYDEAEKQFAHPAVLMVLSPEGKISRYLYGIDFPPRDLKFALLEASLGKTGSVSDKVMMFCYQYDPKLRTYSLVIGRILQIAAALTLLIFGGYLGSVWLRRSTHVE